MNVDRLLMLVAHEAAQDGQVCPQLASEQAHRAAQTLITAVGLTRPEPPRALPPSPVDSPTVMLKTVDPAPRARFESGAVRLPVHRERGWYGS